MRLGCSYNRVWFPSSARTPAVHASRPDDYHRRHVAFKYINVKKNAAELERMLGFSKGRRAVPVIVDGEQVTIGFGGT